MEEEKNQKPHHERGNRRFSLSKINYDKIFTEKLFVALGLVLIIIITFNIVQASPLNEMIDKKIIEAKEAAKPAKLELITITESDCSSCSTITGLVESIKNSNTEITKEKNLDFISQSAQDLIKKYKIKRVPAVILFGETDKFKVKELELRDDALVFDDAAAPYINSDTGKVFGVVRTVLIKDPDCNNCFDLSGVFDKLRQEEIFLKESKILKVSDAEAQELISLLEIKKAPVLLITEDIDAYSFAKKLKESSLEVKEGYYVVESPAPYIDLSSGEIRGNLKLTMITDSFCEDCYDVNLHKQILAQMGLTITEEEIVELRSVVGAKIQLQYDLKKVPTIILSGDLGAYPGLDEYWKKQVGTIEEDGSLVFRNIELLGQPFTDLSEGS